MAPVISTATRDQLVSLVGRVDPVLLELAAIDRDLQRVLEPVMRAMYVPENPTAHLGVILQIAIRPVRERILGRMRGVGLTDLLAADVSPVARAATGVNWSQQFEKALARLVIP